MNRPFAAAGLLVALLTSCRVPLSDAPWYRTAGAVESLGPGRLSSGFARGAVVEFPGAPGRGGLEWNVKSWTDGEGVKTFVAVRAPDGSLESILRATPGEHADGGEFAVKLDGAAGARRVLASLKGGPDFAVSPAGEDAQSFDVFPHDGGLYIAWAAGGSQERLVRVASVDGRAAPRHHRIPLDTAKPYLTSPSVSPIGIPGDAAAVVAYAAAPSPSGTAEVRVARVARGDDGLVRVGAPKPVAAGFLWSRSPRVRASARGGVVVFEGHANEDEVPSIFATALNASGDPVGAPRRLLALQEGGATRVHASPILTLSGWVLAFEETLDGGTAPELRLVRLVTD